MGPFEHVDAYVAQVGGRRLAEGEWGVAADGFDVGLRASRGLLRAQCWAAPAGAVEPGVLLRRHRSLELVRYAQTRAGEVWVVGDVPLPCPAPVLDRLLGALVEAAAALRAG